MNEVGHVILAMLAVIAVIVLFVALGSRIDGYKCMRIANEMELEGKYSTFTGCMVKYNGRWRPVNAMRALD